MIHHWLTAHAHTRPHAPALTDATGTLTWKMLRDLAMGAATRLRTEQGARVALWSENSAAAVVTLLAIALRGCVSVPLHPRWSLPEAIAALKDCGASVVCLSDGFAHAGPALREALPGVEVILMAETLEHAAVMPKHAVHLRAPGSEELAQILYTSGSTGVPKGVGLTHGNVAANARQFVKALGLNAQMSQVAVAPMCHVAGLHVLTMPLLLCGGHSHIMAGFDPDSIHMASSQSQATWCFGVPLMWRQLLSVWPAHSHISDGIAGGAPVEKGLIYQAMTHGVHVWIGYGMTETCGMGTLLAPKEALKRAEGAVGWPGGEMGVGVSAQSGQVWLEGPNVMQGYWGQEGGGGSQRVMSRDIGWLEEDGCLHLNGRLDDVIITGGENVHPVEVERVLQAHEHVHEALVFGRPCERLGERVCAVVHVRAELHMEDLVRHCRASLAGYKLPRDWMAQTHPLPRAPSGKLDRLGVTSWFTPSFCLRTPHDPAPRSPGRT